MSGREEKKKFFFADLSLTCDRVLELDQVEIFNFTEQLLPSQELQASFKSSPSARQGVGWI